MGRVSIDYMNARRDAKPASGGKSYTKKRNAVDDRAAHAAADTWEQAMELVAAIQSEFRSWSAATRRDVESLLRGETLDDLTF